MGWHDLLRRNHWLLWTPVFFYYLMILALSSWKNPTNIVHFQNLDKVFHFGIYLVLGAFFMRAFVWERYLHHGSFRLALLIGILFPVLAAGDELYQSTVPGRSPSFADWGADMLGGVVGMILCWWYYKRFRKIST